MNIHTAEKPKKWVIALLVVDKRVTAAYFEGYPNRKGICPPKNAPTKTLKIILKQVGEKRPTVKGTLVSRIAVESHGFREKAIFWASRSWERKKF